MNLPAHLALGSEGQAPPIKVACAPDRYPVRLHRTRRANNITPIGAKYVGRPTIFANPFERRARIGHKRSVILYEAWLANNLTPYIIMRGGFSEAEVEALRRWRMRLLPRLFELRGCDLQCWCPLTSDWCHANIQLHVVNQPFALERLAA